MAKGKNNKPAQAALVDLAAELGIPSEVAEEVIEIAMKTGDPERYLRNFAAETETMEAAEGSEVPGLDPAELAQAEIAGGSVLEGSISGIPLATKVGGRVVDEAWPVRIGHVQLQLGHREAHLKDALTRLFHGLQGVNARLRGRTNDEPPRPIVNHADAVKWLLEQISL